MVWILERGRQKLICEIRRADGSNAYEFELAARTGPVETLRFDSASELIDAYLRRQHALQAIGWQPCSPDAPHHVET